LSHHTLVGLAVTPSRQVYGTKLVAQAHGVDDANVVPLGNAFHAFQFP
jgi:hypothetical protein